MKADYTRMIMADLKYQEDNPIRFTNIVVQPISEKCSDTLITVLSISGDIIKEDSLSEYLDIPEDTNEMTFIVSADDYTDKYIIFTDTEYTDIITALANYGIED